MTSSARLQMRLTTDEQALIQRAARSEGVTITAFVLRAANDRIEQIAQAQAAKMEALVRARVAKELAKLTPEQRQSALTSGRYIDADGDEVFL